MRRRSYHILPCFSRQERPSVRRHLSKRALRRILTLVVILTVSRPLDSLLRGKIILRIVCYWRTDPNSKAPILSATSLRIAGSTC